MIDKLLIKYASPTLAGLKTGSLFKVYREHNIDLVEEIRNYNLLLNVLDVYLDIIYTCDRYYLIYIYRFNMLINDFNNENTIYFLNSYGYKCLLIKDYISHLKYRFAYLNKTPHEIGVFLGYPLNDVKDFIKYEGKNFKICGCWKVYNDVDFTRHRFKIFKIYTEIFSYLYEHNVTLETLVYYSVKF